MQEATQAWREARAMRHAGRAAARVRELEEALPRGRRGDFSTAQLLVQLFRQAIDRGMSHRLHVFAHREHDVIHLLPVTAFAGAGASWEEFEQSRRGADCKQHLKEVTGRYPSAAFLRERASMLPAHPDVIALMAAARTAMRPFRPGVPGPTGAPPLR
jgi:hypothetical protein